MNQKNSINKGHSICWKAVSLGFISAIILRMIYLTVIPPHQTVYIFFAFIVSLFISGFFVGFFSTDDPLYEGLIVGIMIGTIIAFNSIWHHGTEILTKRIHLPGDVLVSTLFLPGFVVGLSGALYQRIFGAFPIHQFEKPAATTKKCTHCNKTIAAGATVCLYCGESQV